MLGSHNSGSGERSMKFIHRLLSPFARCQKKGLRAQWRSGVRYFDLRVRKYKGKWFLAHGLWVSSVSLDDALRTLAACSEESQQFCHVGICQEKGFDDDFGIIAKAAVDRANAVSGGTIILDEIAVKKPYWRMLYKRESSRKMVQNFMVIEGWKVILPLPYLWYLLYRPSEVYKDDIDLRDFV